MQERPGGGIDIETVSMSTGSVGLRGWMTRTGKASEKGVKMRLASGTSAAARTARGTPPTHTHVSIVPFHAARTFSGLLGLLPGLGEQPLGLGLAELLERAVLAGEEALVVVAGGGEDGGGGGFGALAADVAVLLRRAALLDTHARRLAAAAGAHL